MGGRDHELSLLGGGRGGGAQHLDGTGRAQGPSPTPTPRAPSDRSRRPLCQMTPRRCPRASLRWPRMESWAPLEGAHLPSRTSALPPWDVGAAALGPAGPWGVHWFAGAWAPDGGGGAGSTEQCGCAETRLCRRPGCSSARVGRTPAKRALQGPEWAAGGRLLSSRGAGLKDAGSQARVASEPRPGRTVCSGSVTTISRPVGAGQRPPGVGPGHRCGPAQRGRAVAPAAPHCRTRTPKLSPGHGG